MNTSELRFEVFIGHLAGLNGVAVKVWLAGTVNFSSVIEGCPSGA
jgi:hypothetical protein